MKNKLIENKSTIYLIIFSLSLITRSVISYFYSDKALVNEWSILVENLYYFNSLSLIRFDDLFIPNLWMPPLYAYFIYLHTIIFGIEEDLVKSVIISQIIISSLTSVIFFKVLNIFFDYKFAIIGAIIFCFFPIIVYSSSQISSITIYLFLSILYIFKILEIISKKKVSLIFLGILSGLLILTSRDFIVIFLFSLLFICYFKFLKLKNLLIILIITLMTISPYMLRNYLAFDKLIIHSGLGYNLWKAYNPKTKVEGFQNSNPKGEERKYTDESEDLQLKLNKVNKDKFYRLNEDSIYLDQAIKYISDEPLKYINLFFKRLLSFYFIDLNSSQTNYYNFFHIVPNFLISFLSIFGIFLYKKDDFKFNYICLVMLLLVLVYACFAILPRYKIYILPMQIILGLYFFQVLYSKLVKKD